MQAMPSPHAASSSHARSQLVLPPTCGAGSEQAQRPSAARSAKGEAEQVCFYFGQSYSGEGRGARDHASSSPLYDWPK